MVKISIPYDQCGLISSSFSNLKYNRIIALYRSSGCYIHIYIYNTVKGVEVMKTVSINKTLSKIIIFKLYSMPSGFYDTPASVSNLKFLRKSDPNNKLKRPCTTSSSFPHLQQDAVVHLQGRRYRNHLVTQRLELITHSCNRAHAGCLFL